QRARGLAPPARLDPPARRALGATITLRSGSATVSGPLAPRVTSRTPRPRPPRDGRLVQARIADEQHDDDRGHDRGEDGERKRFVHHGGIVARQTARANTGKLFHTRRTRWTGSNSGSASTPTAATDRSKRQSWWPSS